MRRRAAGNVYLNRNESIPILYQVALDGTATILAGFVGNFGGDGGPATEAQLSSPGGVALDSKGNLFIADTGNWVVREVTTDGMINTVPALGGSLGSGGIQLYYPSSSGRSRVTIPPGQPVGRNSAPVQYLQSRPMQPHDGEITLFKTPGRGAYLRLHVHESAGFAHPP
jgi:hypothetical protein